MIEKIDRWKIQLGDQIMVFDSPNGIITKMLVFPQVFELSVTDVLGWNVYSFIRYIVGWHHNYVFFRSTDAGWVKMNAEKVNEIAQSAIKQTPLHKGEKHHGFQTKV